MGFPFPRKSRAMAKNFTSRGISAGFPRVFRAVVVKRKGTAKFPSRKSRLIGKIFPFGISRENPYLGVKLRRLHTIKAYYTTIKVINIHTHIPMSAAPR